MDDKIILENRTRFADDAAVLVWYPPRGANEHDRASWAWLPGSIIARCAPDEWSVVVEVEDLGEPDPDDPDQMTYPVCFRTANELRPITEDEWWKRKDELTDPLTSSPKTTTN